MTAVFGIEANDPEIFLSLGFVSVDKASAHENMTLNTFRSIRADDIVFIKKYTPQGGLHVAAVGVVAPGHGTESDMEVGIPVEWVWQGDKHIEEFDEKCSRCADPLYEESNITVQKEIIDLMPDKLQLAEEW